MKTKNTIKETIKAKLIAGQGDCPFKCHEKKSPKKQVKKLKKRLDASKNWEVYGDTVYNCYGNSFNGIASWEKNVSVTLCGFTYRYMVLRIDRLGRRSYYAIPINEVDKFSRLPGIELNAAEVSLIKEMANELSTKGPVKETKCNIKHPAKQTLVKTRKQWPYKKIDSATLLHMLQDDPCLRQIIIAVLTAHYRSFLSGEDTPEGIFNFFTLSKGGNSDLWFYTILQALDFVNNSGKNVAGAITITLKDADDLKRWERCLERLAVIRTSTGSLLWPLLERLEENGQIQKCGGIAARPLPSVPISLTRAYLHHPQAIDIPLPVDPPQMTIEEQDLLRTAMRRLLKPDIAKSAYEAWKKRRNLPTAYRTNGLTDWQAVLLETALRTWFPGDDFKSARASILSDTKHQQEEQEQAITEKLQRGVALLTEPAKYSDEIIERPSSEAEWREAIQSDALAFWYKPERGPDKDKTFLVFTSDTIKTLIARAGCTEVFYDAFLRRCESQGILDKRNRTVKLGKDQISAVTFFIEKP